MKEWMYKKNDEQEKRKKAIYEMAESICPKFEIQCYDCHRDCNVEEDSERLFDAGYRKQEEVQKETVKIFLDEIMSRVSHIDTAYGEICYAVETKDILEIAKNMFGLEVEE